MKDRKGLLVLAVLLVSTGASATKVPIPIEGATLNVSVQFQPEMLINSSSTPAGDAATFDVFVRHTRLLVNGDINQNFTYLFQIDNANFGKYGNYTGRAVVQDAWVGWAPTGITGPTVIYIDAGILLIPISHHLLESTTNFVTADVQTDGFRFPGSGFPALRDTGIQVRGWALNKKVGFRGGVFEGYDPILTSGCDGKTPSTCVNPKRQPALRGFVNLDFIGSEEGGWLYGAYRWNKDPVLSVGVAGNYQGQVTRNGFGNLADQKLLAVDAYLNFPMTEANELVTEATVYLNGNGTSSANSGTGFSWNIGYRWGWVAPYFAYDYFQSSNCDDPGLTGSGGTITQAACDGANSRNWKAGLNFFIAKNVNHVNVEFQSNHGTSAYGPSNVTAAAGYTPLSLDPAAGSTTRRAYTNSLQNPSFPSLFVHWNVNF